MQSSVLIISPWRRLTVPTLNWNSVFQQKGVHWEQIHLGESCLTWSLKSPFFSSGLLCVLLVTVLLHSNNWSIPPAFNSESYHLIPESSFYLTCSICQNSHCRYVWAHALSYSDSNICKIGRPSNAQESCLILFSPLNIKGKDSRYIGQFQQFAMSATVIFPTLLGHNFHLWLRWHSTNATVWAGLYGQWSRTYTLCMDIGSCAASTINTTKSWLSIGTW